MKKLILKEVRKQGAHVGTVNAAIRNAGGNPEEYKEIVAEAFSKKYSTVKAGIKKSVRYQ